MGLPYRKKKVWFVNYLTVRQPELVTLLDELPNKFGMRPDDLQQKSTYKAKSKEGEELQSTEYRLMKWKSGYNDRTKVLGSTWTSSGGENNIVSFFISIYHFQLHVCFNW